MSESVSSRITRLQQLLSGKTGRKVPLLDKDALLDAMVVLYNECLPEFMMRDKNVSTFVKKCMLFFHNQHLIEKCLFQCDRPVTSPVQTAKM